MDAGRQVGRRDGGVERTWRAIGVGLGKHWPIVVGVVVAITAVLGIGLTRIKFATGQDSYLDSNTQAAIDNVEYQKAFGGEAIIQLFSMDPGHTIGEIFTPSNISALEALDARLRAIPDVYAVISPLTALQWSDTVSKGPGTAALISAAERDPDPRARVLRKADIGLSLARLGTVTDRAIGQPSWNDFLLYGNKGYVSAAGKVTPPPQVDKVIRKSLLGSFPNQQTAVGAIVLKGNASLDELSSATDAVLAVTKNFRLDNVTTITTGTPVYLKEINDYLQGGMLTLGLLAFVIMAFILIFMFKVRWRLLPLVAVVIGIVWAFSLLGFLGINLSLVTISGLPILIGMGIDFAIQIHNRVEEEVVIARAEHPIAETVANVAPPLVMAVVAAVLAFLALRISQVPMIRDFGVLLAVGITVLLVVGILIPITALGSREWRHRTTERADSITERLVVKLGSLSTRWVVPIAAVSLVLVALGVTLQSRTKIQSDPLRWVNQNSQVVADVNTLEQATGFSSTLGVLIESNNVLAPEIDGVLTRFIASAEARPEVISSSSLVGTMSAMTDIAGATALVPTPGGLQAIYDVAPPDIQRVLLRPDHTATQVNLNLGPASLEQQAVFVKSIEADLDTRLAAINYPKDSVLTVGLQPGQAPVRAVPAGLAVVGVALLRNLTANRMALTYVALAAAALWLVIRFRSVAEAALTLVPVTLAVGGSSAIISGLGITLSPLTTVSGPLVIAACVEFAVLITARYIEERDRGLDAREATHTASARTGRAFFTSGATTIGGFATLMISPLPLLRDFGVVVTLNVAIALLAALVAMPPLLVWADDRGWIGVAGGDTKRSVRLAAPARRGGLVAVGVSAAVLVGILGLLISNAGVSRAAPVDSQYSFVALPTTTTTTTTTTPAVSGAKPPPPINPADYGTSRPDGLIAGVLFDMLTGQGVSDNKAACTAGVLLSRTTEQELLASGIASFSDSSLVPVVRAALDCQVTKTRLDAAIATARGR